MASEGFASRALSGEVIAAARRRRGPNSEGGYAFAGPRPPMNLSLGLGRGSFYPSRSQKPLTGFPPSGVFRVASEGFASRALRSEVIAAARRRPEACLRGLESPCKQIMPTRLWWAFDLWQVRDSNPRRLSRLIYSQIPLAAWVTCRCAQLGWAT